ncbi:MAG: FtsQ-type POTRA domain-containing protein [Pseudomonadota bacterium]
MLERWDSVLVERRALLAVLLALALVLAGLFAALNRPLRTVQIEGSLTAAERETVQRALASVQGARILTLDLRAIGARLDALRWAQATEIRRVWPGTLLLTVHRQVPVARWDNRIALSSTGDLMEGVAVEAHWPLLRSAETEPRVALNLLKGLLDLSWRASTSITRLEERALAGWSATLANGDQVVLGRGPHPDLIGRFQRFLKVRAGLETDDPVHADARYSHGVAVRAATSDGPLLASREEER